MSFVSKRSAFTPARCGVRAIGRPCQTKEPTGAVGLPFPRNPICQSKGEAIYVIDDDSDFLAEVAEQLNWIGAPVHTFSSAIDFQKTVTMPVVGCVLVDVRMPAIDGISLHDWLRSVNSLASVVFLSGASNISIAVDRMKAGALDFLIKPLREMELTSAVSNALAHSRMRYCVAQSQVMAQEMLSLLTPAERRVASLIAEGYVTKQIAAILERSENTIKIHKHKIMSKLGIISTTPLVRIMSLVSEDVEPQSGSMGTQLPQSLARAPMDISA